jgi:hypothetical protein
MTLFTYHFTMCESQWDVPCKDILVFISNITQSMAIIKLTIQQPCCCTAVSGPAASPAKQSSLWANRVMTSNLHNGDVCHWNEETLMILCQLTDKSFSQENHCMINKLYFHVWYHVQVNHYFTTKLNAACPFITLIIKIWWILEQC